MAERSFISRRDFIKTAVVGGLAATLPLPGLGKEPSKGASKAKGAARNLVFLVADGMDHGTLAGANHFLNLTEDRDCEWMRLYRDGLAQRSLVETRSGSALVTDSAAASSAWGCGVRLYNGSINTTKDGQSLAPLYKFARDAGLRTGLVTTARITHATPAGFAANVASRDSEDTIARQYLDRQVDVLLGGGARFFDGGQRKDQADLYGEFAAKGYSVARDRKAFEALPRGFRKTLGVFSKSHMPYSVDMANDTAIRARTPSLSEMTTHALATLADGDERFILQIEGGRVDHGAHANDTAALVFDQLEFDRCVGIVRKFAEARGDTLVIVTTDHGTGGFMINGYGPEYSLSEERFLNLRQATASYEHMLTELPNDPEPEQVRAVLKRGVGIDLDAPHLAYVMKAFHPDPAAGSPEFQYVSVDMGTVLKPSLFDFHAVNWTSQNHTAGHAELARFGPGAESIPAWLENWELHNMVRNALGI